PRHRFQSYQSTIKISTFTARFNFHDSFALLLLVHLISFNNLGLYPGDKERQYGDGYSTPCYKVVSGGVQEIDDGSFATADVDQFWDGSGSFTRA
ncbi:hypothetical protein BGX30_005895, partial [Mortierella sp. GBA39]